MSNPLEQVAQRLKQVRETLGLSKTEVSKTLGIPVEQYQRYEAAEEDIPNGQLTSF